MTDLGGRVPLPDGMRDVLPVEAAELMALEGALGAVFASYGYREVRTPLLERSDVLDRAQDDALGRAYRMFDDQGRVLVLRPDLTIPIARLIATRMGDVAGPVRVSYRARAVRPAAAGTGRAAERLQAGIEMAGDGGPEDDAEVIGALAHALVAAGLEEARIAISSVALVDAVLAQAGADETQAQGLWAALRARSMVAWRAEAAKVRGLRGRLRALFDAFPTLRGGAEVLDAIAAAAPGAAQECARLARTLELVAAQGVPAPMVDLGVMPEWSYYSGVVIEAHAPGASSPVALGGRYDGLGARFGRPRPAVGVAVTLDLLHHAVGRPDGLEPEGVVVVGGLDEYASAAAMLRAQGVAVAALASGARNAEDVARADGRRWVARPVKAGWRLTDVGSGASRTLASLGEGPWT